MLSYPNCSAAWQDRANILQDIKSSQPAVKLLFITPELLSTDGFLAVLKGMNTRRTLSLLAVDEAHCISSWGHDFRPAYRKLGMVRQQLPGIPIMALTATATSQVCIPVLQGTHVVYTFCINPWILDSRPAYRKLGMVRQQLPQVRSVSPVLQGTCSVSPVLQGTRSISPVLQGTQSVSPVVQGIQSVSQSCRGFRFTPFVSILGHLT